MKTLDEIPDNGLKGSGAIANHRDSEMTEEECLKKGPHGRVWKFITDTAFTWNTHRFENRYCDFKWLKIDDNAITVKASKDQKYAWDGNTPKVNMLGLTLGTPDGKLIKHKNGEYKPVTYYASMIHDVIYQYKRCAPVTRREADQIYLDMMRDAGFPLRSVYFAGVKIGGAFLGRWPFDPRASVSSED